MVEHEPEPKRFSPKIPVQLDPPKYDPITVEELSKCDGEFSALHPQGLLDLLEVYILIDYNFQVPILTVPPWLRSRESFSM